jgi:hypothetical protein
MTPDIRRMKLMTELAPRGWREDRQPIVVRGHVGGKCVGLTGALATVIVDDFKIAGAKFALGFAS